MKDIAKEVEEANAIAKFMNKDIEFTHFIVSKFDDAYNVYNSSVLP